MEENKIWKDIPGWEGYYQASRDGYIRSIDRFDSKGVKRFGQILSSNYEDRYGYKQTILSKNNKKKVTTIHRLVALAFLPKIEYQKYTVNHKDGNKLNNHINNLEWATVKENNRHAHEIGLVNHKAENNPSAKLTNENVIKIRERWKPRITTMKRLSKEYDVSVFTIRNIVQNKSWRSLLMYDR